MSLWLPPTVTRELQETTAEYTARVMEMLETAGPVQAAWNETLRGIDARLLMVRAKENASAPGLVPGYYHMMLVSPGAPPTFLPITTPDGSFAEPSHKTLDWLRSVDLQNPQVIRDRELEMQRQAEQREKDKQNLYEEVEEEALERWDAASRTQVSLNRDTAWSQNASGGRAARAHKRDKRRTEE